MIQAPYWFDTHCHPHYSPLIEDIDSVLSRASNAKVRGIICVSTDFLDRERILPILKRNTPVQLYRSVGIHPLSANKYTFSEIVAGLESDDLDSVVMIGETGLDAYRNPLEQIQLQSFEAHLRFAEVKGMPIIMHARGEVEQEAMELIRDTKALGIAHCFCGSWAFAEFLLSRGWYISFSGNITYKKSDALREVLLNIPLDRVLLETDAPFLPPQTYRGTPNEPAYLSEIGSFVANLRQIELIELMQATTSNALRLVKQVLV